MRTCEIEGCAAPHRARGLCSTHYNQQHQPDRHAVHTTSCVVCGSAIARGTKNDRRHVCSVDCRTVLQHGSVLGSGYDWAADAARRARDAGALVLEIFTREEIFERDAWVCYLCAEPVDRSASPFDPSSPTIDHVVPLSRGGEHSKANAACAHLRCNAAKQDCAA